MEPTKILPGDYERVYNLNLAKNVNMAIWLQVVVLVLAYLLWHLFGVVVAGMRTDPNIVRFTWSAAELPLLLISFFLMVVLHEGIHGLFFWVYTKERPKYGFKLAYAYAAAPDWYLPRNQFIMVGLAPLVILSILGVAAAPLFSTGVIKGLVFFLTLNAAGAVGDMFTVLVMLRYSKSALVNDLGEEFSVYVPG